MAQDPRQIAIREHQRWLGYLQPDGLVVSPTALVDCGAQLDTSAYTRIQEKLIDSLVRDEETGEYRIDSFVQFAREFLEWRDQLFDIYSVDALVPDVLKVSTGDYGELLRPDAAFRYMAPADPARSWMLLVRQLSTGASLDEVPDETRSRGWAASATQKFERLLRETQIPIGILCNGDAIRLIYAPRGENTGSVTFRVQDMTELAGRSIAAALDLLLSNRRLILLPEAVRLPAILRKSREYQGSVSTALAEQVLEALYDLVRGMQVADAKTGGVLLRDVLARDPNEVYHALLTVLLRLVFLLFAEDRGVMPGGPLYQRNYSVHGLFEKLRAEHERHPDTMDDRYGAWAQLLALFRLVHNGCNHREMRMPARHGHLFNPTRFPFLESAGDSGKQPRISNGTLYRVLHRLLLLDGERLSYRTLDVEQIGSVYQTMMGFELTIARGTSIALKPAKSKGAPSFLDLDYLFAVPANKRTEELRKLTDHKLNGQAAGALKSAETIDGLLAALDRKIARKVTSDRVPPGSLILQPTDERRRSGSHYTPRALTAPIVRKTLEPIFARLGDNPTPQQILDLKVCDPAVGSGAFLVEACRQLGDALVAAWLHHGGKPVIPPDEDELLHARRLVAQRCLYGVDRNPMATDLAKLSLWLATLAKDHPFTFLDHSLRSGDALVGLEKKQIVAFHWDLTAPEAKERQFGQQELEKAIERATSYRREILEGGDYMLPALKAQRLALADEALDKIRRAGDLCLAAFFDADKPKARATLRERYLDTLLEAGKGFNPEKIKAVDQLVAQLRRGTPHPVTPFHWEIEFPEVFGRENGGFDAFVGNPPYAGAITLHEGSHPIYSTYLRALTPDTGGKCDLIAFFFRRAFDLLRKPGALGFVATNTISQGDTRASGLRWIRKNGGQIFSALRRLKWPGEAAVVVSVLHIAKGHSVAPILLDGREVERITAFLFHEGGDDDPRRLAANASRAFVGVKIYGDGFLFGKDADSEINSLDAMDTLIRENPASQEVIKPYIGGQEINEDPQQRNARFVIDFGDMSEEAARRWPAVMDIVEQRVKPGRMKLTTQAGAEKLKKYWWLYYHSAKDLYEATAGTQRCLVCSQTSKYLSFAFLPSNWVFTQKAVVVAHEQWGAFAIVQSRLHTEWADFLGSSMKDDPVYTPSDCFETFPFPECWETDATLEAAGREYYEFRAELMVRLNEGLTKTYNRFHNPEETDPGILRLRELHAAMDRAVLAAYGWSDLVEEGRTKCEFIPDYYDEPSEEGGDPIPKSIRYRWPDATRDEVLARLLKFNAEHAAEEKRKAAIEAARAEPRRTRRGSRRSNAEETAEML